MLVDRRARRGGDDDVSFVLSILGSNDQLYIIQVL